MLAADPAARPTATAVLTQLRAPVAHIRELGTRGDAGDSSVGLVREVDRVRGVVIDAAPTWSDAELDALGAASSPWCQPILDRRGRQFVLAAWPAGCQALGADIEGWRDRVPPEALALDDQALRRAIEGRLRPSSLVATAARGWMLALDDLLSR
jgi:hypothetical protein